MSSYALREQARRLASAYRRALDLVIDCYRRIRGSAAAKRELDHARELQSFLEKDLAILGSAADLPAPQTEAEQ